MRNILLAVTGMFLLACNSPGKKDPNQAMDDTARMRNPLSRVEAVKSGASEIPASIQVKGTLQEVWKWTDNLGENILITSYMPPFNDKRTNEYGEEGMTAELYAFHYAGKEGMYREVWSLKEVEPGCPFDLTLGFIPGSVTVTDLDSDNMAETKLQYIRACRSDVSPATMKLVLQENNTPFALTGYTWLADNASSVYDVTEKDVNLEKLPPVKDETAAWRRLAGRYETEKEFANAPPAFLNYARSEWLKYSKEKIGE